VSKHSISGNRIAVRTRVGADDDGVATQRAVSESACSDSIIRSCACCRRDDGLSWKGRPQHDIVNELIAQRGRDVTASGTACVSVRAKTTFLKEIVVPYLYNALALSTP